jgi:hypothetical protein
MALIERMSRKPMPSLSPVRQVLANAIAATKVHDHRGERLRTLVDEAEQAEQRAREHLDDLLAEERTRIDLWSRQPNGGPKPVPATATIDAATRQLENRQRELSIARQALADHDAAMEPVRRAAADAVRKLPGVALAVLENEAAAILAEWKRHLRAVVHLHAVLDGLRSLGMDLSSRTGDLAGYATAERVKESMAAAIFGFTTHLNPGMPPDQHNAQLIAAKGRWTKAVEALVADPAADLTPFIEEDKNHVSR